MQESKVITSNITRDHKSLGNNLYELITVTPAIPTPVSNVHENACGFQPITGKSYTPKKRIKFMKVRTVRDIRNEFESDVSADLSKDLDKQQNILLKRITSGSSREENTKTIARNMLKCDKPVSRTSWQMLMNVNPEGHPHAIQYVLWNGRRIRVNGSKGGKNTFLCNYDLANIKLPRIKETKHRLFNKKKGLLRNSLSVKFKPGPLTRKMILDDSYQKYNVGKTELLTLPKPALDIQPIYGVTLDPIISNFIQNLRHVNGTISKKWAEFAVSVLGAVRNTEIVQNIHESSVTFELNYKFCQSRMLLRRDIDNPCFEKGTFNGAQIHFHTSDEADVLPDVKNMLKEMLDSVEISLQQDSLFTGEDDPREISCEETVKLYSATKDKSKKRYGELGRLDVTVIQLPDIAEDDISITCKNAHCSLGCICVSLKRSYILRQHCGRVECMFECKCDFSKYKLTDSFDCDCPELIPGLINLDTKLNFKLAKEEQKFHQTVLLSGEKSILLKSQRRNWKATKKYGKFYETMCLKNDSQSQRILSVVDVKLNCEQVEPWCMVHNLYKCFCKGKFTQINNTTVIVDDEISETVSNKDKATVTEIDVNEKKRCRRSERNSEDSTTDNTHSVSESREIIDLDYSDLGYYTSSARIRPYTGRKFLDAYYINTNKKIVEMEQNDTFLRKRMLTILNRAEDKITRNTSSTMLQHSYDILQSQDSNQCTNENNSFENTTEICSISSLNEHQEIDGLASESSKDSFTPDRSILNSTTNKTKLIAWLESSYKQYKHRIEQGIIKKSLDPPKHGKVALYPWEFILSRYRERKNLFLISQQTPFRIFMAVDSKNSFFDNCINIDDIRFADLHKYPCTVKNLLTNATDLKDKFCILCGLPHCWELIGSVTKLDDHTKDTDQLQRVSDDTKIGFVAKDKEQASKPSTSEISFLENYKDTLEPTAMNNTEKKQQQKSGKRGKKRHHKTGKLKMTAVDEMISDTIVNPELPENILEQKSLEAKNELQQVMEITDQNQALLCKEFTEIESETELNLQSSKWFVMTVEKDFSEIQFYNRGFFVKYESIIKAINVARMSGKTVRLSSQKGVDQNNGPQFGIYAIPNSIDYYVFIGPYEKDEPLGIEIVKSFVDIRNLNRTRGVWITTKKIDNIKVIDNPLSFMPNNMNSSKIVSLDNELEPNELTESKELQKSINNSEISSPKKDHAKTIKPIRIRKANGFYQLSSQRFLTQLIPASGDGKLNSIPKTSLQPILFKNIQTEGQTLAKPLLQLPLPNSSIPTPKQKPHCLLKKLLAEDSIPQNLKPVAEIAPQIKIVDVYSETATDSVGKKLEACMFVLKPEEINKRLMENRLGSTTTNNANNVNITVECDLNQDIENFLATSSVFVPPNADIFEISDEEDDQDSSVNWRNVWIECKTAVLGYLRGRKNTKNMLSFEFPGFKFTDFYKEEDAFTKINQVLSRKIYVPKSINLKWHVVESIHDLNRKYELKSTCLGPDYVLTKRGVRHKLALMGGSKSILKTNDTDLNTTAETITSKPNSTITKDEGDNAMFLMSELEEQSKILEAEGDKLINELAQMSTDKK